MQARALRGILRWIAALALVLAAVGLGYLLGHRAQPLPEGAAQAPQTAAPEKASILYWTCAMHPQVHEPGPGKCPICGMDLIPVRAETGAPTSLREFVTSAEAAKLMQIEVTPVERRSVDAEVRLVGKMAYDETRLKYITAWVPGRLDRLYVDYTGVAVAQGDNMVDVYSPDLVTAQAELLQALEFSKKGAKDGSASGLAEQTLEAAREKLRLLGLTAQQIVDVEQRGKPADHVTVLAPIGGIVIQKSATQGMYVEPGTRLYTIADLSHVWLMMDAYESDLAWLRLGQDVSIEAAAYPGRTLHGSIAFIDPVLDPMTRTVKVRVDVPNPDGALKPEMFAHTVVHAGLTSGAGAEAARPLVIPASAALVTGTRAVVYVELPGTQSPTFEGREIVLGPRAGDAYVVRSGLKEGELVVTNGNFKIDSALEIQAKPSMMNPEGSGTGGGMAGMEMSMPGMAMPEGQTMPQQTAMGVPDQFGRQLRAVTAAADAVAAAVEAGKPDEARSAYHALGDAVAQVNADLVSGDARLMWKELAMLLTNDAVEGGEAVDLADAVRVGALLKLHVGRLGKQFNLAPGAQAAPAMPAMPSMPTMPATSPATPAAPALAPAQFRAQLSGVWHVYRDIASALAADDGAAAAKAAAGAQAALNKVDMSPLSGEAMTAWMTDLAKLQAGFGALGKAGKKLDALRTAFAPLSDEMAAAIVAFGVAPDESVYEFHCPMALGGKGANWLQAEKEKHNPYQGAAMPTCGDLTATIAEPAAPVPGGGAHD